MFIAVGQFVAIFWFLSKGGVDVYMPDDISTRFTDVWGQDNVLERVQENMVFLENPEEIEERGGHVPTGILLWGPPGTGKTLLSRAASSSWDRTPEPGSVRMAVICACLAALVSGAPAAIAARGRCPAVRYLIACLPPGRGSDPAASVCSRP